MSEVPLGLSAVDMGHWPHSQDFLEVYVSAVEHPSHFWVQVISSKATQLDRLQEDMTHFYDNKQITQVSLATFLTCLDCVYIRGNAFKTAQ